MIVDSATILSRIEEADLARKAARRPQRYQPRIAARLRLRVDAVRDWCEEYDYSMRALAHAVGVSEWTVYRLAKGRGEPSGQFVALLLAFTGEDFETFFAVEVEPPRPRVIAVADFDFRGVA